MKIFGFEISRKKEKRDAEPSPPPYSATLFGEALPFANLYNRYSAMNISAVYRATEVISDSVAILPVQVKKNNKNVDSSLSVIFKYGSNNLTKYELIKMLVQSVMLHGNGYALIERDNGIITGLRYVESGDVQIFYDKVSKKLHYTTNVTTGIIKPEDIIHLKKNSWDGVHGVSILTYAARALDIAHSTENAADAIFKNGCNLAGVIECTQVMQQQQKIEAKQNWMQSFSEGGNGVAILSNGMTYKPVQISSSDAQMLESRLFNVSDIARFFGISPVLLGDLSHSSYNTIEATQQQFLINTLQPYITMIEEEFTKKLCLGEEVIDLDETAILKTDKAALANYYSTLCSNGILTINEIRKELGYSEVEGGDKNIVAYTNIKDNTINKKEEKKEDDEV